MRDLFPLLFIKVYYLKRLNVPAYLILTLNWTNRQFGFFVYAKFLMCNTIRSCFSQFPLCSYGHLQAINRTHLYWSWENTHDNVRTVFQDYLWIIQEKHGMRMFPEEPPAPVATDATEEIQVVEV